MPLPHVTSPETSRAAQGPPSWRHLRERTPSTCEGSAEARRARGAGTTAFVTRMATALALVLGTLLAAAPAEAAGLVSATASAAWLPRRVAETSPRRLQAPVPPPVKDEVILGSP